MCIVTGPNIDIAIKLIKRTKSLFERKLGLTFANKEAFCNTINYFLLLKNYMIRGVFDLYWLPNLIVL